MKFGVWTEYVGCGLAFAISMASSSRLRAEIRLPRLLSDHAVLQRGLPIHVWGWSDVGSQVVVHLHDQTVKVSANEFGEWSTWLQPEIAGGPYQLTVEAGAGQAPVTVSDILVGDVWLASGQSNMELPLGGFPYSYKPLAVVKNAAAVIAAATNPNIRLLKMAQRSSDFPLQDGTTNWTECTPSNATTFSAVAYLFGRDIESAEGVPIGLIDSTWGGTAVDAWMSLEALSSDSAFMPVFANRAKFVRNLDREPLMVTTEKQQDEAAKKAGKPLAKHPHHPFAGSWLPAGLYNGMISPLTQIQLKGVIWYQGESDTDADRAPNYEALFIALIRDWRTQFSQPNLPFLYAQISSFDAGIPGWPLVRDAQRRALVLRNTAMAMTTDVGEPGNVHPADKQTVGARLALAARAVAYGEHVAYEPPLFRQAIAVHGGMQVWFDHAEGLTATAGKVDGFEIAGEDHKFQSGDATLEGNTVMVASPLVSAPRYVRYGWTGIAPSPLRNSIGLPASTFTSEELTR